MKPLPFRNSRKQYGKLISEGGNYASATDSPTIIKILEHLNEREDIKNIVVDDFQYIMSDEFLSKVSKKGYDKFNEIAKHAYDVITYGKKLRPDINFICITHSEYNEKINSWAMKTIGKLLEDKVVLEGLFTVILYALVSFDMKEKKPIYNFVTNKYLDSSNNEVMAKSPVGMFDDLLIPNDLGFVIKKAEEYYG